MQATARAATPGLDSKLGLRLPPTLGTLAESVRAGMVGVALCGAEGLPLEREQGSRRP
jgi:hypothetical protein